MRETHDARFFASRIRQRRQEWRDAPLMELATTLRAAHRPLSAAFLWFGKDGRAALSEALAAIDSTAPESRELLAMFDAWACGAWDAEPGVIALRSTVKA